jgi:polyhydroxybutyrate depolymerase
MVDGAERRYRLVVPKGVDRATTLSLVVAFHGAGDTAEQMAEQTNLDRLASSQGFLLAYPEGRFQSWPPFIPPENPSSIDPDLRLFDVLCAELSRRFNIDRRRIYVVGTSQGAAFVELLVAKRSCAIAAAAAHSGWLPKPLPSEGIHADCKTPILLIVGSEDRQVPPPITEEAVRCFAREGHPVEYLKIPGVGHRWALEVGINARIWTFLSAYRLP